MGVSGSIYLATVILLMQYTEVGEMECIKCGYDLTGNVSGVCPECGSRAETVTGKIPRDEESMA